MKSFAFLLFVLPCVATVYICADQECTPVRTFHDLSRRARRSAIMEKDYLWNPHHIPYDIDSAFDEDTQDLIRRTLKYLEINTCLRFIEENGTAPYISYRKEGMCESLIGKQWESKHQNITIGQCYDDATGIFHETLHALGFEHEHCRADRDEYVEVHWDNIMKNQSLNYEKANWTDSQGLSYDYASTMHYGIDYSADPVDAPTMSLRDKSVPFYIGDLNFPTFFDFLKVNKLYKCNDYCQKRDETVECENGGYPHPRNCKKCWCPYGFSGDLCTEQQKYTKDSVLNGERKRKGCKADVLEAKPYWMNHTGIFNVGEGKTLPIASGCYWWIQAPAGKRIVLEIHKLSEYCSINKECGANIEVKTGNFQHAGYRFTDAESFWNTTFYSGGNLMILGLFGREGVNIFQVSYKFVDDDAAPTFNSSTWTTSNEGQTSDEGLSTEQLIARRISTEQSTTEFIFTSEQHLTEPRFTTNQPITEPRFTTKQPSETDFSSEQPITETESTTEKLTAETLFTSGQPTAERYFTTEQPTAEPRFSTKQPTTTTHYWSGIFPEEPNYSDDDESEEQYS